MLHLSLGYLIIWRDVFRQEHKTAEENAEAEKRRESFKEKGSCQWLQWYE